jgi:high-affinity iron transporter
VSGYRPAICLLALAASLVLAVPEPVTAASANAQQVVFLLQYIGTDYPAAVQNGEIVNSFEYQEMTDFAAGAREKLGSLRSGLTPDVAARLEKLLEDLEQRIGRRVPAVEVRELTDRAIDLLVDSFQLKPVPRQLPRIERAAALYRDACATCHGEDGEGTGPEAEGLEPPPADFTDRERMASAAPYVFYNAITFGIDGTAMASFRDSLDEQERWDLAFFLWGFVAPERPPPGTASVRVPLRDLATRSTDELAREIHRRAEADGRSVPIEDAKTLVASLRFAPRPITDHEERLANVRREIRRSLEALARDDLEEAAEVVTSAYLEHFEPLEPQIDRIDPAVRQRFERGLIDFRKALRAGEGERARTVGRDLLSAVDDAEALFGESGKTGRTVLLLGGFAGLLLVGLLWMVGVGKRRAGE